MNKSVFVTGATNGTGFAIAERFAKEGYSVFIGSRDKERSDAAAKSINEKYGVFAKGYQTEIFDEENVKAIQTLITKSNGEFWYEKGYYCIGIGTHTRYALRM